VPLLFLRPGREPINCAICIRLSSSFFDLYSAFIPLQFTTSLACTSASAVQETRGGKQTAVAHPLPTDHDHLLYKAESQYEKNKTHD
jgi:hypothetical protein